MSIKLIQHTGYYCPANFTLIMSRSSGNHAAALALAAQLRGIPAYIVAPQCTPQVKVDAVREYGGDLNGSASYSAVKHLE